MVLIWVGALLLLSGLMFMAAQPLWRGRLSGGRIGTAKAGKTLEPPRPTGGLSIKANWPGLVLVALGAVLMLAAAAFRI
jgi:hypothetical protein